MMQAHFRTILRGLLVFGAAALLNIGLVTPTLAISGSDWRAGRIMDDSVFYNKSSMSIDQIQAFLNAKMPTCDNWGTQSYAGTTRRAYQEARGVKFPLTCLKDYHENPNTRENNLEGRAIPSGAKSAANIIWDAAQQYNINPQVLVVLLQKEQALVLDDWPIPIQYRSATGYGCPDTAACDTSYYGFYNQVTSAAYQFRRYANFPNQYNHIPGRVNAVRVSPNGSCGTTDVFIDNQATASLYNYTPYQPNAAALNNLSGTGDGCSAYGNRNFWRDFNNWFGASLGDGFTLAKSDDASDLRQWVIYGNIKQHVPDAQTIRAWNLQNVDLVSMPASSLGVIPTGPSLDRLVRHNGGSIYFVDDGKKYKMPWDNLFGVWNLQGRTVSSVSSGLFSFLGDGGDLTYSLKDPSSSDIYMLDGRNDSGQTVLRKYQSDAVRFAWEGAGASYTTVSSDFWDSVNDAIGGQLTSTKVTSGGTEYQAMNRCRRTMSAAVSALYPGSAQAVSSATIGRLTPVGNMTHLIRSVSSPTAYLIDGGVRHQIPWPDLLTAWSIAGQGIVTMNDAFVDLIPAGSAMSGYLAENGGQLYIVDGAKMAVPSAIDTAYRNSGAVFAASSNLLSLFSTTPNQATAYIRPRNAPQVYLLDSSGKRRHIQSPDTVTAWGGYQTGVLVLADYIVNAMAGAAGPTMYVSDGSNEYIMEDGKKVSVSSSVKADWGLSNPQVYSDGTLNRFTTNGSLDNSFRAGGGYFIGRAGGSYGTADPGIAEAWGIQSATQRSPALTSILNNSMLTRYVRSNASGDSRTFLVDGSRWYNVAGAQYSNLKVGNHPAMSLSPSLAPSAITDISNPILKNAAGAYFVIDDGGRRSLPGGAIANHWTNFGNVSVPTVSDGFINSLANKGIAERVIKGSGPAVYSADNATKRHIQSPHTYNQFYAPFGMVSDSLIDALTNGSAIP